MLFGISSWMIAIHLTVNSSEAEFQLIELKKQLAKYTTPHLTPPALLTALMNTQLFRSDLISVQIQLPYSAALRDVRPTCLRNLSFVVFIKVTSVMLHVMHSDERWHHYAYAD